MNVEEALAGIARRWSRDGGMGNDRSDKDYTDAGCRVLARNAFDDVEVLLAVIAELRSVVQAVEEQTVEFEKALAEIDRRGLDAPSTRRLLSATVGSLRAALALADPVRPRRYDQCDETCTVDCGHCKGRGKPVGLPTETQEG